MLMFALPKASYKFNVILIKIQNSILHRRGGGPTNPKIHIETNPTLDEQSNSEQKSKSTGFTIPDFIPYNRATVTKTA